MVFSWPCILINNLIYNNKLKQKIQKYIESKDVYVYSTNIYAFSKTPKYILTNEIKNQNNWIKIDNYFNYIMFKNKNQKQQNIKYFECFKIEDKNIALQIIYQNNLQEKILNEQNR